jgi:Uma2 family endonuclease
MSAVVRSQDRLLSHEEYFALEQAENWRYEYRAGQVFAMAGGSESHALISSNILVGLANALRNKPCRVYGADMKLHIAQRDRFVYPDVQVLCEKGVRTRQYVENPVLIVEVLSPGTQADDRNDKFSDYRSIAALEYYLLVSQHCVRAELYEREAENRWLLTEYRGEGDGLALPRLGIELSLADLYRQVAFEPPV